MVHFLEQAWESIGSPLISDWDPTVSTCSIAAVVLAAIWLLFRIIRTVVAVLFVLCVALLVLKVCYDIDLSPWLQPVWQKITTT